MTLHTRASAIEPTSAPTTAPSADSLLPPEFALFQSRSAFSLGGHTANPTPQHKPQSAPDSSPQSSLVLRGIAQIDDHFTALFEDSTGKTALQLSIGDPLAYGRVKSIDLDQVQFESAGDCRPILVGQNLKGETVARPPASQPAPPPTGDAPDTSPPGGGPQAPQHGRPRAPQGQPPP